MYVKPKTDLKVPDPARGDTLPPQGRNVEDSQYWHRRISDGDVEVIKTPTEAPAAIAAEPEVAAVAEAPAAKANKKPTAQE